MKDPGDSGVGNRMATGDPGGKSSTTYGPMSSTNDVQRTGRPDGMDGIDARTTRGSTRMRGPKSPNVEKRTGRPDSDAAAPQRSYGRAKAGSVSITDVSSGRVRRSKS